MGIELMLNSVNLNLIWLRPFVASPRPIDGQVFAVFESPSRGQASSQQKRKKYPGVGVIGLHAPVINATKKKKIDVAPAERSEMVIARVGLGLMTSRWPRCPLLEGAVRRRVRGLHVVPR